MELVAAWAGERCAWLIFLTNRVYYGREPNPMKALRPRVHDAAWRLHTKRCADHPALSHRFTNFNGGQIWFPYAGGSRTYVHVNITPPAQISRQRVVSSSIRAASPTP